MSEENFRYALRNKDKEASKIIISSVNDEKELIFLLYEMLLFSVSLQYKGDLVIHPTCLINSIKTFISEKRNNPPLSLLEFGVNYMFSFELRKDNKVLIKEEKKLGKIQTIFTGEFEKFYNKCQWNEAFSAIARIYLASDRSRAAIDILVEFALRDCPRNAIFVFHLLRAYQFQNKKEDNWMFISSVYEQLQEQNPKSMHESESAHPDEVSFGVAYGKNIAYFSAMNRLWKGDYVRINSYRRELSYWLGQMKQIDMRPEKKGLNDIGKQLKDISYVKQAEKIIKLEKSFSELARDLVFLESVRSFANISNQEHINNIWFNHERLLS